MAFRGSITRRLISLSTLRSGGYPLATQDSLPAAGPAPPDGIGYPQDSQRKVSSLWLFSFPELLGAMGGSSRALLGGVVGGVGDERVLNAVAADLGLHDDVAFAHLVLPVKDRDQDLAGRAAYPVGTSGEAFDDPRLILGRLLPRALWGRWGLLTFPGCQKGWGASRRLLPQEEKGRALRLMAVRQTRL
jgi:hypothetical protein